MNTFLSSNVIELIFNECMRNNKIYFGDGSYEIGIPKMIIRHQKTGQEYEFNQSQLENAKRVLLDSENIYRVMDVGGSIYCDTY